MIRYGQVKGRKYPVTQPLPEMHESQQLGASQTPSSAIVVDGSAKFRTVSEAAAFAGVQPWEVRRVLAGERRSVKGHTFSYEGGVLRMGKKCRDCGNWGGNVSDCESMMCDADMCSDDPQDWFVKRGADHECHRPDDYIEMGGGDANERWLDN